MKASDLKGGVASGTRFLFLQTTAPTGWTKDTSTALNDTGLRISTVTLGSKTNANTFSSVLSATVDVDETTLTTTQIPSHQHSSSLISNTTRQQGGASLAYVRRQGGASNTNSTGGDLAHKHGINFDVMYVDAIVAEKD